MPKGELVLEEIADRYRAMTLRIADLKVGDALPERSHTPTNVSLFMYNAAVWNPHRIHYDETYTTQVERHPAIVIDGPLQGDWLAQCVTNWLADDGTLVRFSYSNRKATYLGETLVSGGRISAIDAATTPRHRRTVRAQRRRRHHVAGRCNGGTEGVVRSVISRPRSNAAPG